MHLSDLHLTGSGHDLDGVDAAAALTGLLADCRQLEDLDAVLVSGDIADDGSVAGYRIVREAVGAFAAARGIPHLYCTGNHDDRTNFAAVLASGHLDPGGTDRATRVFGPRRAAASTVGGLRLITLDSLIPQTTPGELDAEQLHWLAGVLAEPSPDGSVLVLHHPPVHVPGHPMAHWVLRNPARETPARTSLARNLRVSRSAPSPDRSRPGSRPASRTAGSAWPAASPRPADGRPTSPAGRCSRR